MLKSMTGYGTETISDGQLELNVEVKSLNSKFMDVGVRMSRVISDKEIEVRNLVTDSLVRGKVSVNIEVKKKGEESLVSYNELLFENYYRELKRLADKVGDDSQEIFRLAVQSPDVTVSKSDDNQFGELWDPTIKNGIQSAIAKCDQFRIDEGKVLQEKLVGYISEIEGQLKEIIAIDPKRVEKVRERIAGNLQNVLGEEQIDQNRFEQELIYYIEKLDISEEKVRLTNHLDYFMEVINLPESNGKKLGFIGQEIGREINTIGSKANDAAMQKRVVVMKEELEKIKEQVLNVL
jgi:uncharacterized protein (TIGR00255 family)